MLLLAAVLQTTFAAHLHAQEVELPANFVKITNAQWVSDGLQVAIGAWQESNSKLYMLSSEIYKTNYLKSDIISNTMADVLTIDKASLLWTLEQHGERYVLRQGNRYIAKGSSDTQVRFTEDSDYAIAYRIEPLSDGTFQLAMTNMDERYLALYTNDNEHYYFGNYKESTSTTHLHLYRYEHATQRMDGDAVMPEDGIYLTLYSEGYVPTQDGVVDATDLLLRDGSIAVSEQYVRWFVEVRDASTFALYDDAGKYINIDFQSTDEETWWTLREGTLWQGERVLRYVPSAHRFMALTADEVVENKGCDVCFLPVAEAPQCTFADGILTAKGGFTASALSEIDWQGAYLLDLTQCVLPQHTLPFLHRETGANNIVVVSEDDAPCVSSAWNFTLSKGKSDAYTLLTPTRLVDRAPLILPADVRVKAGQVTLERQLYGDGGWETLVLPFATDIPEGLQAETLTEIDEDNAYFTSSAHLAAGTAALIRPISEATRQVVFVSKDGLMTTNQHGTFVGTYSPLIIESAAPAYYFLNSDGTQFVRAAAGSRLAPFRAALLSGGTLNIRHR
ncbi:MAG: hypothetical protein IJ786_00290 [Bacteroidaceae bacterium]|nr:hypothetical protein [Bacteroidaceae bacterium]